MSVNILKESGLIRYDGGTSADTTQLSNPNLLDNPFFTINQRGFTESSAYGYTIDRWTNRSTSGVLNIKVEENGITLTNLHASSKGYFSEYISSIVSEKMIFSVNSENVVGTSYIQCVYSDGTYSNFVACKNGITTLELNENKAINRVNIQVNVGASITIKSVKLEVGSISTLANDVAPNYATELYKCQQSKADTSDTYANGYNPNVSEYYSSSKSYVVGDMCIYQNAIYKCILACSNTIPTNTTYWTKTSLGAEISSVNSNLNSVDNATLLLSPNASNGTYTISLSGYKKVAFCYRQNNGVQYYREFNVQVIKTIGRVLLGLFGESVYSYVTITDTTIKIECPSTITCVGIYGIK